MSKLRYKEGGVWKSIAPSQKEFDDNKLEVSQQLADMDSKVQYFEAPSQPSFTSKEAPYVWATDERKISDFVSEMIDPLLATSPKYVTRNVLGKDASGIYDIVEYDFNPLGAEQTILLTSGVHGRETVPVYSMYRLMHYLINEPDVHPDIRYLREKIRIKIIPSVGVWAGSQLPTKSYGNSNGYNVVRDFDYEHNFNADKTPVPYSQAESVILRDWFLANKKASFYADFHTDYSWYDKLPTYDNWVFRSKYDNYLRPILDNTIGYLSERVKRLYPAITLNNLIEDGGSRVTTGKYATEVLEIPWFTMEYCETRYGGFPSGSADVQNHLTIMTNHLINLSKADLRKKIERDKQLSDEQGKIVHMFNNDVNGLWKTQQMYDGYDKLVTNGFLTKTLLGRDASDAFDLVAYSTNPTNPKKTINFLCDSISFINTEGLVILKVLQLLQANDPSFNVKSIRDTIRIRVVPTMNPWGFNQIDVNTPANSGNSGGRTYKNAQTDVLYTGFGTTKHEENIVIENWLADKKDELLVILGTFGTDAFVMGDHSSYRSRYFYDFLNILKGLTSEYNEIYDTNKSVTFNTVYSNDMFDLSKTTVKDIIKIYFSAGFSNGEPSYLGLNRGVVKVNTFAVIEMLRYFVDSPIFSQESFIGTRTTNAALSLNAYSKVYFSSSNSSVLIAGTGVFTPTTSGLYKITLNLMLENTFATARDVKIALFSAEKKIKDLNIVTVTTGTPQIDTVSLEYFEKGESITVRVYTGDLPYAYMASGTKLTFTKVGQ